MATRNMAAKPAHVMADVAIEKMGEVVKEPMAMGERMLKSMRSSALNCTYANGIEILVILRAEWSVVVQASASRGADERVSARQDLGGRM